MAFNTYLSTCTTSQLLGTGEGTCDLGDLGDLRGIFLMDPNEKFLLSDNFSTQYNNLIKGKKLFPLLDLWSFDQTTPENETATNSVGIMYEIREGKPQFTLTYSKSHCYHKSVFDKKGYGNWRIGFVFENRIVLAKSFDGLSVSGFKTGMFSVGTFKFKAGTDPQQTTVMFQLTDVSEFNTRMVALNNSDLALDVLNTPSFINVDISYPTAPTPGTTFDVDVKSSCSGNAIAGLTGNTKWKLGGNTAKAITTVTESATIPGRYTVTVGTALIATDTIQPYLSDGTYNVIADAAGVLYSGQAPLATI